MRTTENDAVIGTRLEGEGARQIHASCFSLPEELSDVERKSFDRLISKTRNVKKKQVLFRKNDPFKYIFAINAGFFKTTVILDCGQEYVTGFYIGGDTLGWEGIADDAYAFNAIAIGDSQAFAVSLPKLIALERESPHRHGHFLKLMSREIKRTQEITRMIRTLSAEGRVANFLLEWSNRYRSLGYSSDQFYLFMSRKDIGSYLGLAVETISRIFSEFKKAKIISMANKRIHILDKQQLALIVERGN